MTTMSEVDLRDRARLTKRDQARGIPGDAWVRPEGELWHMIDAQGRVTVITHCGLELVHKKSAAGTWRAGHWPNESCVDCIAVVKAIRVRVHNSWKPDDPLSAVLDGLSSE